MTKEILSALVIRPLLALLGWVKRNPGKTVLILLVWFLWQVSLVSFLATMTTWIAKVFGQKIGAAVANFVDWFTSAPHRLWWAILLLIWTAPLLGWWLFWWHLVAFLLPSQSPWTAPVKIETNKA